MLQVYDRVLPSGSIPTLVGLSVLALGMYSAQSIIEVLRSRLLFRTGEKFEAFYVRQVHANALNAPLATKQNGSGKEQMRDLDNVRAFIQSNGPTAFFDMPWIPFYLSACFILHFWLGATALIGAVIIISLTLTSNSITSKHIYNTIKAGSLRETVFESSLRNAEIIRALGMGEALFRKWSEHNGIYLTETKKSSDWLSAFGVLTKTIRTILQSAMLGVGAYLVVKQEVTPGTMIASSIMMGRAMAPVDIAISQWKPFIKSVQSWKRLKPIISRDTASCEQMTLPAPTKTLKVDSLTVVPPGGRKTTLKNISFQLCQGQVLGVIGASASGKSTLARTLVGVWKPLAGKVSLDGAGLDQWDPIRLSEHIGYLPQAVELFEGTIAENISRFTTNAQSYDIVAASKASGAHEMIVSLENGYDTQIGPFGNELSTGQRQRIGLARALFGNPFMVVLDEPNAHLDAEGELAVMHAITSVRQRGGIVIVFAHRPSVLKVVDAILRLENGTQAMIGPRDAVLAYANTPKEPNKLEPPAKNENSDAV